MSIGRILKGDFSPLICYSPRIIRHICRRLFALSLSQIPAITSRGAENIGRRDKMTLRPFQKSPHVKLSSKSLPEGERRTISYCCCKVLVAFVLSWSLPLDKKLFSLSSLFLSLLFFLFLVTACLRKRTATTSAP